MKRNLESPDSWSLCHRLCLRRSPFTGIEAVQQLRSSVAFVPVAENIQCCISSKSSLKTCGRVLVPVALLITTKVALIVILAKQQTIRDTFILSGELILISIVPNAISSFSSEGTVVLYQGLNLSSQVLQGGRKSSAKEALKYLKNCHQKMGPPYQIAPERHLGLQAHLHVKMTSIEYLSTRKVLDEIIGSNLQFSSYIPKQTFFPGPNYPKLKVRLFLRNFFPKMRLFL